VTNDGQRENAPESRRKVQAPESNEGRTSRLREKRFPDFSAESFKEADHHHAEIIVGRNSRTSAFPVKRGGQLVDMLMKKLPAINFFRQTFSFFNGLLGGGKPIKDDSARRADPLFRRKIDGLWKKPANRT